MGKGGVKNTIKKKRISCAVPLDVYMDLLDEVVVVVTSDPTKGWEFHHGFKEEVCLQR